jgi:hypothetical protein
MKKTILTFLALAAAATTLSACVIYSGAPRTHVIEERETWVPAHQDEAGVWVPGHWR